MRPLILIFDDEITNVEILSSLLERDYDICSTTQADEVIALVQERRPDLLLLDIATHEEEFCGFRLLQEIKSNGKNRWLPVIFETAYSDSSMESKGLKLGAVDYISKPYSPAIIRMRVHTQIVVSHHRKGMQKKIKDQVKELEKKNDILVKTREAIVASMAMLSEYRDSDTGAHIQRVSLYSKVLCDGLMKYFPGLISEEDKEAIVSAAPLHDLGKIGISDAILLKKGPLTIVEFEKIKKHSEIGYCILQRTAQMLGDSVRLVEVAKDIALYHHERFDGTGYPKHLKGEEIPISARVVNFADIYDALASARPYKNPFSVEDIHKIILEGDGRCMPEHFDPRLLQIFKDKEEEFKRIAKEYSNAE